MRVTANLVKRSYSSAVTAMMNMPVRNGVEETPGVVVPLLGLTLACD